MRKLLVAVMAGSLVHPAGAQVGGGLVFCTNCATEPTQASVKLMHDLEYAKQLLQYAIQVQQLADALKNTLHGSPASLTSIAADLGMLAAVVQGGRALAWSLADDDVVFRSTYPGYPALAAVGPPPRLAPMPTGMLSGPKRASTRRRVSSEVPVFKESCWRPSKECSRYCEGSPLRIS
jgi:P-type conjugative transfer protein TrbJ